MATGVRGITAAVLRLLLTRESVTTTLVSKELGISRKSAYRYLEAISVEWPVEVEEKVRVSKKQGCSSIYRMADGWRIRRGGK